ncbi:DUF3027 domain-containing protein [Cellulomonas shaoxiangyii]|uniref:DUF3027 domain-containing protein n=1 Tax=Cellulomonas shaoxiangyii TaxID=2566013 RepID=A0A4P7SPC2_9CELL|nr:DUF3027 domain-containing protein [Cellulomonas shaoxiangyii]TGY78408.1 DUF3027 domain-containing protein [Cellulomonas shaoxiangyii]
MAATKDAVLDRAVDLAREVALEIAEEPSHVGEYLGAVHEGDRLVSHRFACTARGYRGWAWTVTVARVPRGRTATVCEAELLPAEDAILPRPWLPWSERLRPGDIGPGDVLPFRPDDPRLEPGWTPTGDPELDEVAIDELALARVRVLSPQGRDEAAERWYRGSRGPTSAGAVASAAACGSCGFLVPLQGSLGTVFGVCANAWSPDDGKVVSLDHGCGAHSETDVDPLPSEWPSGGPLIDETSIDVVDRGPARVAEVAPVVAADDAPTDALPTEEVPTDEVPTDAALTDEATTDEAPTDEVPTDEVPAPDAGDAVTGETAPPEADAPVTEDVPADEDAAAPTPAEAALAEAAADADAPADADTAADDDPEVPAADGGDAPTSR